MHLNHLGHCCVLIMLFLGTTGCRENDVANTETQSTVQLETKLRIPFTLTDSNNISVLATLNGVEPVKMMFHTGVSSVSLTREATKRISSVNFDNSSNVETWGGKASARFSENNSIEIFGRSWDKLTIHEGVNSGKGTDGKFGPNFFDGQVVEIDFDVSVMTIHASLPELDSGFEKLELRIGEHGGLFIQSKMRIGKTEVKNLFMIHSGFGGTILFDDKFVKDNNIDRKLKTISERELRDSYDNVIKTKKAILPSIMIGTFSFDDIPIGFFHGAIGRQKMSVIGGNLLKRFNIFLDMKNKAIYLKPNKLFNSDFADA